MKLLVLILVTKIFEGANFQCFCIVVINYLRTFFAGTIGNNAAIIKTLTFTNKYLVG